MEAQGLSDTVFFTRPNGEVWYGTPTPAIDCVAAASEGNLTCAGAIATKHGAPTTVSGYGLREQNAVVLNGSTDYFDLGNTGIQKGGFTLLVSFAKDGDPAQIGPIVGRDALGSRREWDLAVGPDGDLVFYGFGIGGSDTISLGPLGVRSWNTACVAYSPSADGTSTLAWNLNGIAGASSTLHVLRTNSAPALQIGTDSLAAGRYLIGRLARVTIVPTALSATECAKAVASNQGLLALKPAGALVSFTGSDGLCCPQGDAQCFWLPAGVPCISAAGIRISSASVSSNSLVYSNPDSHWTLEGTATVATNSASCPIAPDGTQTMSLVTFIKAGEGIYRTATGVSRSAWLARATVDSDCNICWGQMYGGDRKTVALTGVPRRSFSFSSAQGDNGIWFCRAGDSSNPCTRACVWGAQVNGALHSTPYYPTAGAVPGTTASNSNSID